MNFSALSAPRLRSGTESLKYEILSTKYDEGVAFYGWEVCQS
jgi:hypothetical protein